MPRRARSLICAVLLGLSLTGCELTARFDTTIQADGSGDFTVSVALDQELRDQLTVSDGGIEDLEGLFARLGSQGWQTTRFEPDGGLELRAVRAFADAQAYEAALEELRTARSGAGDDSLGLDGLEFDFGFALDRSLARTRATFDGTFDTSADASDDPSVRRWIDALADAVHFEVSAQLPGSISVRDGEATVRDGVVEWRPRLGESVRFRASAGALRPAPLLGIFIPALTALALVGWLLMGRRARRVAPEPHRTIVLEPANGNGPHTNGHADTTIVLGEPLVVAEDPPQYESAD